LNFGGGDTLPFFLRDQSSSDKDVIQQIFVNKNYELARLARFNDIASEYKRILGAGRTPLIIDCGANISASPIWFAKSFPNARILALEPEPHNYEMLQLNCRKLPNIKSVRGAISCTNETLFVEDPGAGDWGFRTTGRPTKRNIATPAYSIESVVRQCGDVDLFLVKIDIEGGESRLFEREYEWIERTELIIIELHDWMLPRSANSQNCLRALSQYPRDFVSIGENAFSIRNP
jgi:FkbM family methyltransferase